MNDMRIPQADCPLVGSFAPRGNILRAHTLPDSLNPWRRQWGFDIVALTAFELIPHMKYIPAYEMLISDFKKNLLEGISTIVIDSSGNTGEAGARFATSMGFRVIIVMASDVPKSKQAIIETLSTVELSVVPTGVAERAKELGKQPGHYHLDQYAHPGNILSHYLHTGPAVFAALGGVHPAVVAVAMGTGGTAAGVAKYFAEKHKSAATKVLGIRPVLGQDVPGARDANKMKVVTLPWQEHIPAPNIREVSRKESFIAARQLWSGMIPRVGPTSGLAYAGLCQFLENHLGRLDEHELRLLRGKKFAFICPDGAAPYVDLFSAELRPEEGVLGERLGYAPWDKPKRTP